jgi:serine protease Do
MTRGDVVLEAAGAPVEDVAALNAAANAAEEAERPLLLRVFRDGRYLFLAIDLGST